MAFPNCCPCELCSHADPVCCACVLRVRAAPRVTCLASRTSSCRALVAACAEGRSGLEALPALRAELAEAERAVAAGRKRLADLGEEVGHAEASAEHAREAERTSAAETARLQVKWHTNTSFGLGCRTKISTRLGKSSCEIA